MLRELVALRPREVELRSYQETALPEDSVRVKVEQGSVKHGTELTVYRREDPFVRQYFDEDYQLFLNKPQAGESGFERKLGNMWVGRIVEIGKRASDVKLNQRVAGYGPLRSTITTKAADLLKVDESMSWKAAVCYDPAHYAFGGIRDAQLRLGDTVAVSGLGAIGLLTVQMAKLAGAALVVGIDPLANRREVAVRCGADHVLDPEGEDVGLRLKQLTGKKGVDAAVETSGSYEALQQLIRGLRYTGTVAIVGWYKPCTGGLHFGMEAHFNQPNLLFSRSYSEPNRDHPRWNFQRIKDTCWQMLKKSLLACEEIVQPVVPFEHAAQAFAMIDREPGKCIKLGVTL
jgi:threonine dehydrogenase-like Zn-dependent dehydrogenase